MAELPIYDTLVSCSGTTKVRLIVPAVSSTGLVVLVYDQTSWTGDLLPLPPAGAGLDTAESLLQVPVLVGKVRVTALAMNVPLHALLSTPVQVFFGIGICLNSFLYSEYYANSLKNDLTFIIRIRVRVKITIRSNTDLYWDSLLQFFPHK